MNQSQEFPMEIVWVALTAYGTMLLIMGLMFAVGFWLLAGRMGRNRWLWAILAIIPFVNFLFFFYTFFAVLLYALDRLNGVAPPPRVVGAGGPAQPGAAEAVERRRG